MSKIKLPTGHPFAAPIPPGMSPYDLAARAVAFRRGFSGGMSMKLVDGKEVPEDDPREADPAPVELDPEDLIKVGDKNIAVKDLQGIMAREKRQGKTAGQKKVLEALGFATIEEAQAALTAAGKPAPKPDDKPDEEAAKRALERETEAEARERKAAEKERRADLRTALVEAGCTKADLDDAFALLDRKIDKSYDEDDVEEAVEELKGRRPGMFGAEAEEEETKPPKATIPPGRQPRPKAPPKNQGAEGRRRAERRGWIKTDA